MSDERKPERNQTVDSHDSPIRICNYFRRGRDAYQERFRDGEEGVDLGLHLVMHAIPNTTESGLGPYRVYVI